MNADRQYSLSELDRMRAAVRRLHPGSGPGITSFVTTFGGDQGEIDAAQNRNRYTWEAACEDKLRTYMLAGIGPDDLETKLASVSERPAHDPH